MADELPIEHRTFFVTIQCVECGWTWEWWGDHDDARTAMDDHTREAERKS